MKQNLIRNLLIIDDDLHYGQLIQEHFSSDAFHVFTASTCSQGLSMCSESRMDIVLLDQKLPDGEGYKLCPAILKSNDKTKIIFITAFSSLDNAIKAIRSGAYDYLTKPFEVEQLELVIQRALRTLDLEKVEEFQKYRNKKDSEETILIGKHPEFVHILKMVELGAKSDAPVLITGETGTGKTAIAHQIHYLGNSSQSPFVSINCNSLPDNLFEAELFGYEKGAFTDAQRAYKGIFLMADGGSLLLDEIGCLPKHLQAKILSVLEDQKFKKLGSEVFTRINVRIMAATNSDLEDSIKKQLFREDLYYRLNVIRMHIPPLRERKEDIPNLCNHFLNKMGYGSKYEIADAEFDKLIDYHWPGNIRELKNVLERCVILQSGPQLFPSRLLHAFVQPVKQFEALSSSTTDFLSLEELEQNHIRKAMELFHGNYAKMARALKISLSTLKRKTHEYGIPRPQ